MYCGCNPTALSSQTQISQALIRLMLQKPFASVSVSELCREAGVSRPTFYYLFSSLENVVLFTLQEKTCEIPHTSEHGTTMDQLCRCYSQYIWKNRAFLKLLVQNNVGYLLYNSICDSFLHCQSFSHGPEPYRLYAAHFIAGGITGVVRQYCTEEPPISADVLYEILRGLFNGTLL